MPAPGFTSVNMSEEDYQRLTIIMRSEGLKTKTETVRMLMRDWDRNRKPEIAPQRSNALQGTPSMVKRAPLLIRDSIAFNGISYPIHIEVDPEVFRETD